MNSRLILVAIVALAVGFIAGVASGLIPRDESPLVRELKMAREENAALQKMVDVLKAERAEVQAALERGRFAAK